MYQLLMYEMKTSEANNYLRQYLELTKIQKLLVDHGTKLDVIAGASAPTAIETTKITRTQSPAIGPPGRNY